MTKFFSKVSFSKISLPFKEVFSLLIILNFLGILIVFIIQNNLPPVVPLLYGLPKGGDQLMPKLFLVTPLGIAQIITVINLTLITLIKDAFSQKALVYLAVAVSTLALITTIKIILLVGSF